MTTMPADSEPTLDQRRARHAWDAVARVRNNSRQSSGKSYAREAKRLPVRVLTAGLGHALAFLNAKAGAGRGESANVSLSRDVADWCSTNATIPTARPSGRSRAR